MGLCSRANFQTMKLMGPALTFGVMERYMLASGNQIKCMDEGNSNGLMGSATKENLKMIRDMVMECLYGVMAECTMGSGETENNTVGEYSRQQTG